MSADECALSIGMQNEPSWASLPANVLVRVFLKLSVRDLCYCSTICHRFWDAAQSDSIWDALLQQQYDCSAAIHAASKECMRQLRTASLWTCGSNWTSTGSPGPSSTTTLLKLWPNIPCSASSPLDAYCAGPSKGFVVTVVAAGRHHLLLLTCDGRVIDTRAPPPVAPPPPVTEFNQAPTTDQQQAAVAGNQAAVAAAAAVNVAGNPWEGVLAADAMAELLEHQQQVEGLEQHDQHQSEQPEQQQLGVLQLTNPWRPPDARIASVAAGPGHVLAVSSCGGVWGWGSNECGQLGLGHNCSWQGTPVNINQVLDGAWKADGDVIVSAACGDAHSALLAAGGAVYTAGCNKQGQCAQGIMLRMCPVFCQVSGHDVAAAAIACGVANTVVATRRGRLLVCGDSSCGQCGPTHIKQGCCHTFIDMGPEVTWHGLNRPTSTQVAAAGGYLLDALPKVTQVAAGCGTGYAVTDEGEVYAWGAGSKGQLGRGGCTKVQGTPAKLPWAKHITHISASLDGAFAAAVDNNDVLYTWGAGKWGQLGHGDTSKRTVGRAVKQLKHQTVLQAVCGSESLLVLTCDRPYSTNSTSKLRQSLTDNSSTTVEPTSAVGSGGGSCNLKSSSGGSLGKKSSITASAGSSRPRRSGSNTSTAAADAVDINGSSSVNLSSMEGVDWVDVEGHGPFFCPRPRSGYARQASRTAGKGAAAAATNSANVEFESSSASASESAAIPDSAASSSHRASTIRKTHSTLSSNSSSSGSQPSHTRRLTTHSAPASPSGGSHNAQGLEGKSPGAAAGAEVDDQECAGFQDPSVGGLLGSRHERMDKGFKRLLKRLLKQFVSDNKQRELEFPASLSSADRYHIHVAADAWRLGHASHHDENGDRVIKVWKVSRSRRMVSGADAGFDPE